MEELKKFARYFKPYKWRVFLGVFFILISMAFGLYIPYLIGRALDDISHEITWVKVTYYAILLLVVSAGSGIFLFLAAAFC